MMKLLEGQRVCPNQIRRLLIGACTMIAVSCATHPPPQARPDPLLDFVGGLEGQVVWLKVGMVRVQFMVGAKDFTNVMPGGDILYTGIVKGFQPSQAPTVEGIEREISRKGTDGQIRLLEPGTKATITRATLGHDGLSIQIIADNGQRMGISLKHGRKPKVVATFVRLFSVAFATSAAEAAAPEVAIELGMTIDEVLSSKGSPGTRVELGAKTILTYPDLKLIFEDGKLVDAE